MKNFNNYITILVLSLISIVSTTAGEKKIPVCTNSGTAYLPSSEISKINGNNDGTMVSWLDNTYNGALKIQKLDEMGNAMWAADGVLIDRELGTGFTADSDYPLLFSDNEGGAVMIYRKMFIDREEIYMHRFFQNGSKLPAPVCLSTHYGGYNYSPSAVMLSSNEIAVAWENFRDGEFNIHAQLISLYGKKLWNNGNEIQICNANYDQRKPTIACSENNFIMTSWLDAREHLEYSFDLFADIRNKNGESVSNSRNGKLIFKNTRPVSLRKEGMSNHNMVSSEKGSFIIALEQSNDLLSNVIVLKVNTSLEKLWLKDLRSGSHQSNPLITKTQNEGAGIIWNDSRENQNNINGIVIDKDGNSIWGGKKGKKMSFDNIKTAEERILPSEKNTNGFCIYQNCLFSSWVTTNANKLFLTSIHLTDESVQNKNVSEIQDEISEGEYTSITAHKNNIVTVYLQSGNIFASVRNLAQEGLTQIFQKPELENFPNPFNPSTKIYFSIPSDGFVRLSVFDISGRLINTLINEHKIAGEYNVTFDGSDLSSGVYFCRLEANGAAHTKRMTMLK